MSAQGLSTDGLYVRPGAGSWLIAYPSGQRFRADGHLGEYRAAELGRHPVIVTAGEVILLDPRAVITAPDGSRVYGPRSIPPDDHQPVFREWLAANPAWDSPG